MAGIGTAIGVVGSVVSAASTIAGGQQKAQQDTNAANAAIEGAQAQQTELDYRATQYQQQAGQTLATGQRQAITTEDQAALLESNARATAGAQGGTSTDPDVVATIGRIGARGDYDAASQIYNSKETASGLTQAAQLAVYEGQQAITAGQVVATADQDAANAAVTQGFASGLGTIAGSKGVQSMFDKYAAGFTSSSGGFLDPTTGVSASF